MEIAVGDTVMYNGKPFKVLHICVERNNGLPRTLCKLRGKHEIYYYKVPIEFIEEYRSET